MAALKVAVCDDEKHILKELCVQIEDAFLRAGCNISLAGLMNRSCSGRRMKRRPSM